MTHRSSLFTPRTEANTGGDGLWLSQCCLQGYVAALLTRVGARNGLSRSNNAIERDPCRNFLLYQAADVLNCRLCPSLVL
jgi:hypothetical protein